MSQAASSRAGRLSPGVGGLSPSATLKLAEKARALGRKGIEVLDFGPGEPAHDSPRAAVAAAANALETGATRYGSVRGLPSLRESVAAWHRERHGSPWRGTDDSLITVGGKAALFQLALATIAPGDEVVIPSPTWVSFAAQVRIAGGVPVNVEMSAADHFALDVSRIRAAMTEKTRAVVVNSPGNPTGRLLSAAGFEELAAACAERSALLVSDEAYERYVFEGAHASAAELASAFPETVALVGTFSKSYAMTGWRVGYLLCAPAVLAGVARLQGHAVTHPATFAMHGAVAALASRPPVDAGEDPVVALYRERRERLALGLDALPGFSCRPPEGSIYLLPNVEGALGASGLAADDAALADRLLEEAGIATVPGSAFGAPGYLRFSFAVSEATIDRGLERLAQWVETAADGGST